jgi:hypothetical protein
MTIHLTRHYICSLSNQGGKLGGMCDTYRREESCMQDYQRETEGNETTLMAYANMSIYY